MKLASLLSLSLSLYLSLSPSSHAQEEAPLTEETAKGMREMYGIRDLGAQGDADAFAFREDGNFLVSHQTFTSQPAAQAYCAGKQGYQLTRGAIPGVITMMGLPFMNLHEQMILKTPAIPGTTYGTGVIAWARVDLSTIPEGYKLSEKEQQMVDLIKSGDFVMAWTDGDGGSGDGIKAVSLINLALKAQGKPAVAMSAICVEDKLEKEWR